MIGGGRGGFIGAVHRIAAQMDAQAELVAGAFSSDPKRSRASGRDFYLDPTRVYGSYGEMARAEAAQPRERRLDFVVIVTPNHEHFRPAKLFLELGFNVVCDKPVAFDLAEAKALRALVAKTGKVFVLSHNYTGNAMVRQARQLVRAGKLGVIRKVVAEYPQGWLATRLEATHHKQASWKTDPKRCGASGCLGDIGTHAHNLARYITGLEVESICAELSTFIPGRLLDDDGNCLVRFSGGVKGILFASQISSGEENNLNIRVFGTQGSLQWFQENPNELIWKKADAPQQVYRRGNNYVSAAAAGATRTPFAHPEGFIEAFANVYRSAAVAIADSIAGRKAPKEGYDFPTITDGLAGMAFIETAVKSGKLGAKWVKFPQL